MHQMSCIWRCWARISSESDPRQQVESRLPSPLGCHIHFTTALPPLLQLIVTRHFDYRHRLSSLVIGPDEPSSSRRPREDRMRSSQGPRKIDGCSSGVKLRLWQCLWALLLGRVKFFGRTRAIHARSLVLGLVLLRPCCRGGQC